jgi:aspartate racemase
MKRIGILGGMGPESTIIYYQHITRTYYERFGNYAYPEILIYSVNFQKFINLFTNGKWDQVEEDVVQGLDRLQRAGADFGIMATNTLHHVFEKVEGRSSLPLISIIDSVLEAIRNEKLQRVGLLGTIFTMTQGFYAQKLAKSGIQTLVPSEDEQQKIQQIIVSELTIGQTRKESRDFFLKVIRGLEKRGAQGIILGCTEIPLLLDQDDCTLELFNSTLLHAESALRYALNDG